MISSRQFLGEMHMPWKYIWESPNPKQWKSLFIFDSFAAAVDNAIWHARNGRKRKNFYSIPPEPNQRKLVWKSMRKAGWKIRRKKVRENESVASE